ncbi:MAG: PrsW family glutamic-type intramembrane protease, partial [Candidatus Lutacidiplasmatales archaeon]
MASLNGAEDLAILLAAALLPALAYLTWVRKSEQHDAEPWGPLLSAFAYGALFATFVAGVIEVILVTVGTELSTAYPAPEFTFLNGNSSLGVFFLVLVIAPFVEEAFKAAGLIQKAGALRMISDGPVVGASVGLGFGFFETLLYGLGAFLSGGLVAGLGLIFVRSISSVLLHGSTTAMFGYGYAEMRLNGRSGLAGAYYLLAVVMHSSFNALASLPAILSYLNVPSALANDASLLALIAAVVFAFSAIEHVRSVIARTNLAL